MAFQRHFVEAFPDSQTRSGLYKNWLRYTSDLKRLVGGGFTQWLNGSFVTQKLSPNDLDLVAFLPFEQFHQYENDLEAFWSFSREAEGLDAYLIPFYPRTHLKNAQFTQYRCEWDERFKRTRDFSEKKGFVRLTIR